MSFRLAISCEHFSNEVPADLRSLFKGNSAVLDTHRAVDIGADRLYDALLPQAAFAHRADRSRLLIELNRSLSHRALFSEYMASATDAQKESLQAYYQEYRSHVTKGISDLIAAGHQVIHIGVHSFTPVFDGVQRNADIGLLYDPASSIEKEFASAWKQSFLQVNPDLKIRFNYPYLGKADGFTTSLRKQFPSTKYAGIELEVNQHFFANESKPQIISQVAESLKCAIEDWK